MKIETLKKEKTNYTKIINDDGYEFLFSPLGASLVYIKKGDTYFTRNAFYHNDFKRRKCFYGKTIGRVSNRIKGHDIEIEDMHFSLRNNEGENTLHGGIDGLSNQYFSLKTGIALDKMSVTYTYISQDGESGFPGELTVEVTYVIYSRKCQIDVGYVAFSNKTTLCSLTNHSYFTLGDNSVNNLYLQIDADKYIDVDEHMIAKSVKDVDEVMDFRKSKRIGKYIDNPEINHNSLRGYDHFYYFNNKDINKTNIVLSNSEYKLSIKTDFEGVQIYTTGFDDGFPLLPECQKTRHSIAIEPSDNHLDLHYLRKGEKYERHISYQIEKADNVMDNEHIKNRFKEIFCCEPEHMISCGGRFEILGNHTDHNHGLCLAATCNLNITAAIKKADPYQMVVFHSSNYPVDVVRLHTLYPLDEEKGTSKGLIRGIAEYLKSHGYKIGGFVAYSESSIFPGAGVSSSAAFELLVAQIFNELYNDGKIPTIDLCKAGQYAENRYFGKASGLLDQIGVGFGNISFIDFKDIANPKVEQIPFPFDDLHFVIINTGGSHAQLSHLYSAIPQDMYNAAKKSGKNFLREVDFDKFNNKDLTPMEYGRALHFFGENDRVQKAVEAIKNKDQATFLQMINWSRESSTKYLKNMMVENEYKGSPLEACDYFMEVTGGEGAIKINGGGFAGSVIAVVPTKLLNTVLTKMADKYGENNVQEVFVREKGPAFFE